MIAVIIILTPTFSYIIFKRKLCFAKQKGTHAVSLTHGTVIVDPGSAQQSSGTNFGTLQRQRTLSRKLSAKSRLSSTFTEQYFQADIVYDPEWEVRYDSLEFKSLLGEGAFGRVMKGISDGLPGNSNETVVAIKMLKGKKFEIGYFYLFSGQRDDGLMN